MEVRQYGRQHRLTSYFQPPTVHILVPTTVTTELGRYRADVSQNRLHSALFRHGWMLTMLTSLRGSRWILTRWGQAGYMIDRPILQTTWLEVKQIMTKGQRDCTTTLAHRSSPTRRSTASNRGRWLAACGGTSHDLTRTWARTEDAKIKPDYDFGKFTP